MRQECDYIIVAGLFSFVVPATDRPQDPRTGRRAWGRFVSGAIVFTWFAAILGGMGALLSYKNTPGPGADPPTRWPIQSSIHPPPGRATLVMLAHPHCPCTRASIHELAALMTRLPSELSATVLLVRPPGVEADWEMTDLFWSATAIPGVTVLVDTDGHEAGIFRAQTSGQTVVYDANGRLIFSGGITPSRGHEGDNVGRSAIVKAVTTPALRSFTNVVFGCSLFGGSGWGGRGP
jgi:hypothetical protein